MTDRFSGPAPRGVKIAALLLGLLCLVGMSGLGLFYSLDREIEERVQAGEQSSRGTLLTAYPDLMWRLLMQRKFPKDYGPQAGLSRGTGSLCDFFIERDLPRAQHPWYGWLAKPFSEHLVTTYIEKQRLMLYFANDWDGPPRGLDHQAIKRFGRAPAELSPREQVILVLAATGVSEDRLVSEASQIYKGLAEICRTVSSSRRRPRYCDQLQRHPEASSVPSGSRSPSTGPE